MRQNDIMLKKVQACLLACCWRMLQSPLHASYCTRVTQTARTHPQIIHIHSQLIFDSFETQMSGGAHGMVRTCACLGQPPASTRPKRMANPAVISVQPPLPACWQAVLCMHEICGAPMHAVHSGP